MQEHKQFTVYYKINNIVLYFVYYITIDSGLQNYILIYYKIISPVPIIISKY